MTSAPFTPEQEARIREIAIDVAAAATRAQAQQAAGQVIDRLRVTPREVEEFLSENVSPAHD